MDKDFLLKLTNNLYRLTLLFPKKEPLRYKMREVADEILADLISTSETNSIYKCNEARPRYINSLYRNLEILDSFFEVAKTQNWVSSEDVLAIQKEYDNLREELKKIKSEKKQEEVKEGKPEKAEVRPLQVPMLEEKSGVNERQEKILAFLKENSRAQVWQVKQIFPEVSKRTLRRDFEHMLNQGLIERIGERNDTFYQIKMSKS